MVRFRARAPGHAPGAVAHACSPHTHRTQVSMFLPYRIIFLLGVAAALTAAWSAAPREGAASVDMEVIKLTQGLRTQTETSVSSTSELEAALADPSIDAIVVQDGAYKLTATLEIKRSVSIRAATNGKAVLDGCGAVGVLSIATSGTVNLAGLQITGGHADKVGSTESNLSRNVLASPHCGKFPLHITIAGSFQELTCVLPCSTGSREMH